MITFAFAAVLALAGLAPAEVLAIKAEVAFGVDAGVARQHAQAALAAARPGLPADLLVAVAAKESSLRAGLHGRLKTDKGVSRFCGALQAMSRGSLRRCVELTNITVGYAAGAAELEAWLQGRCRGDLDCALRCHACGNKGLRGECQRYARSVHERLAAMTEGRRYPPRQRKARP